MSFVETAARRLLRRAQGERRLHRVGGRRSTDFEPKRGWIPSLVITLAVAGADWTAKALVARSVPLGAFVEVWPERVALWHVRNHAMILGLYGGLPLGVRKAIALLCAMLALLLLFDLLGRGHRLPARRRGWVWLFIGLSFGGMLGNLGERVIHWGVTDYLSLRWGDLWLPPGNLADVALFLSLPLALLVIVFELQARARRAPPRALEPAGPLLGDAAGS